MHLFSRWAGVLVSVFLLTCSIRAYGKAGAEDCEAAAKSDVITRLRSEGGYMIDGRGRVTLLRGANLPSHCYKPMKFNERDLDALESFGFNFIRLGISWDKAEPREGEVDLEYIQSLVEFARKAGEHGIYVLPEVHKYGWCNPGSDWPEWTCEVPVKDSGDFISMFQNSKDFWNSPPLQAKLIDFWKIIVKEFRTLDNVVGYEPMNEPLDATMLVPGLFDKKLFDFYERWILAVKELDPQRAAFLEPSTANMIVPMKAPPFNHDNLAYAPHPYYVHTGEFIEPETDYGLEKKYRRIAREAKSLSAPLIIGEYGGDPDTPFARRWLEKSWELQDRYFAGAAIWVYNTGGKGWDLMNPDYTPREFFRKNLRRPYPRHTAGEPVELSYRPDEKKFLYRFSPDHSISAPTEIFVPPALMAGKVSVQGASWSFHKKEKLMSVKARPEASVVKIKIESNPG